MDYFRKHPDAGVTSPSQIAVVGDRLFTDVMMANLMGSYGFWVRDGIIERKSFVGHTIIEQPYNELTRAIVCAHGGQAVCILVEARLLCT
jgi:predicted HAD superfamily phosphohydrolase YqeG